MRYVSLTAVSLALAASACGAETGVTENNKVADQTAETNQTRPAEAAVYYNGLCEASAAEHIDNGHFAVASDDSDSIIVFRRRIPDSGAITLDRDVSDIEAAARTDADGVVYWLTSHSFSSNPEHQNNPDRPKRKFLVATTVSGSSLAHAGTDFGGLRAMIATALGIEETALKPELNIEGLAATPEGHLVVGLRRPLTDGRARLVRIANPRALVGLGGPAGAAQALPALDLGGYGIRSIENVGTGERAYLILAGPVEDSAAPFRLYWRDGATDRVSYIRDVSFDGASPEALIAWSANDIQVLGDNGGNCKDDDETDQRPRRFPSIDLRL